MKTKLYTRKGLLLCVLAFLVACTASANRLQKQFLILVPYRYYRIFAVYSPRLWFPKAPPYHFYAWYRERGNGTTQVQSVAANAIPNLCSRGATMKFT